jgi:antitoxin component of MazEF toxin-antitoxin module
MAKVAFTSTVSKSGDALIIRVPDALHPQVAPLKGRKILVTVEEVTR